MLSPLTAIDPNQLPLIADDVQWEIITHSGSTPLPANDSKQPPLIADDAQSEIMTHSGSTVTAVDPQHRITAWTQDVEQNQPQVNQVITIGMINVSNVMKVNILMSYIEPGRKSPLVIPKAEQLQGEFLPF